MKLRILVVIMIVICSVMFSLQTSVFLKVAREFADDKENHSKGPDCVTDHDCQKNEKTSRCCKTARKGYCSKDPCQP